MVKGLMLTSLAVSLAQDCRQEYDTYLANYPEKHWTSEGAELFCSRSAVINEHNKASNSEYKMGFNAYTDVVVPLNGLAVTPNDDDAWTPKPDAVLATSIDWRSKMPSIKNQGSCSSCWAYAAIDVLDFYGGSYSEQQLMDCSQGANKGCDPGNTDVALTYLLTGKIGSEALDQYPDTTKTGTCVEKHYPTNLMLSKVIDVTGYDKIMAAMQNHVVAVRLELSEKDSPFSNYQSGVYSDDCGTGGGHFVGIVGYAEDYWIMRNSWGETWGEKGYAKFKKGIDLCKTESVGPPVTADVTSPTPPPPPPTPKWCHGKISSVKFRCEAGTSCCGSHTLTPSCIYYEYNTCCQGNGVAVVCAKGQKCHNPKFGLPTCLALESVNSTEIAV